MATQGYHEELLQRWFPHSKKPSQPATFAKKDIREISSILERAGKLEWSRVPRLYIVLRLIDKLDTLEGFIQEGISDTWFPFDQRSLPERLHGLSDRAEFLETQKLICNTRALNLERADAGHGHFPDPSDIPLKKVGDLGRGASGFVERVISTVTHREYALKRIRRGTTFRKDKTVLRDFENELSTLKRLSQEHLHIIELIASFTEPKFVGLLFPVADCNLAELMASPGISDQRWSLRTYFGCLASALGFLHDNKIRHKDIKSQNILIKDHAPFFTDFGVSIDWTEYGQSTTVGPTAMTPRYCAPEVAEYRPRNSSSDIWSLGCVFLEIFAVLNGATIKELATHFTLGTQIQPYHSSNGSISTWIDHVLGLPGPDSDNLPARWIRQMLARESEERWSAHLIVENIREHSMGSSAQYLYGGRCCLDDDDTTESVISYIEPLVGFPSASTFYEPAPAYSEAYHGLKNEGFRQEGDYFGAQMDNVEPNSTLELEPGTASYTESSVDPAEYSEDEDGDGEEDEDGEARTIMPDHEATDQSLSKLSYAYRTGHKTENFVVYRSLSHSKIRDIIESCRLRPGIRSRSNAQVRDPKQAIEDASTATDRSKKSKQGHNRSHVYTKLYKHVLERSAISDLGYDFKETHSFFFIVGWISDDEVVELIEESEARKFEAKNARSKTLEVQDTIEEEDELEGVQVVDDLADYSSHPRRCNSFRRSNMQGGTPEIRPPGQRRSRSVKGEAVAESIAAETQDSLKAPKHQRSRSLSKDRITQPQQQPLEAASSKSSKKISKEELTSPRKSHRRRSKDVEEASGAKSSLLSSNAGRRSGLSHLAQSAVSGTSSMNNPKLLATVEDAIERLILPELNALKEENRDWT